MQIKMKKYILISLGIFLIGFALATSATSSSYNIEKIITGVSSGNATSSTYSFTSTSSENSGSNFTSTSYQGSSDAFTNTNTTSSDSGSTDSVSPSSSINPGGGGGGSSSSSPEIIPVPEFKGFTISPDQLSVSLVQGEVMTEKIVITNQKNTPIIFTLKTQISESLVFIKDSEFSLNPKESKEVSVDFIAREDTKPGLFLGKIIVKGGSEQTEILVALNVESKGALLDVKVELSKKYKKILQGDELLASISMYNLGITKRADINLKYTVTDFDGKIILSRNETIAIETQTSFFATLDIPQNAKYGKYVLYVEATYDGKVAGATANFEIVHTIVTTNEKVFISIIILLIMVLSAVIYYYLRVKYPKDKFKKVDLADLIKGK